jgi:hypothetical protein
MPHLINVNDPTWVSEEIMRTLTMYSANRVKGMGGGVGMLQLT